MTTDSDGALPLDVVFDQLAHRFRRYLLYCLFQYSNPVSLPRVADQAVEWETGQPADAVLDERLVIYMELYHDHLPGLVEHDVVTYHQESDTVALHRNDEQFEPYVERAFADEIGDGTPS